MSKQSKANRKFERFLMGPRASESEQMSSEQSLALTKAFVFEKIASKLLYEGFDYVNEKIIKKNYERFGLVPPKVKRIEESLQQVSFQKWFDGDICLTIHTSFNPTLGTYGYGEFTKRGTAWVVISKGVTEGIYFQQVKRHVLTKQFADRLIKATLFMQNRLNYRPVVPGTSVLFEIQQTFTETKYVSPLDKKVTHYFLNGEIPDELRSYAATLSYRIKYYQKNRKKNGIKKRAKDLRKKWLIKNAA
ncbi:MAG: hypothetical protein NTW62_02720 [Candidatus Nomurabacteria bacterium]|nr:hypothetical protein [Candidatus Nomurabacteria bacterium]